MTSIADFLTGEEREVSDRFLRDGHMIMPAEDRDGLNRLRNLTAALAAAHLKQAAPKSPAEYLDRIHERVAPDDLNALRLAVINGINATPWARAAYFSVGRRALEIVVGNELAMQLRLNLSIQLPGDASSLLPVHADVWSGDSPFEVVLWIPLVDCQATKSMFLLPPAANDREQVRLASYKEKSAEELFKAIEPEVRWLTVPYGSYVVFSQNLMHGNRVNRESTTRWSMNCRFKGLFSPYADKRLGEFFEPITLRAATRLGARYRLPDGFDD